MAKKPASEKLELPVEFGNITIGVNTAKISVTVDRSKLKVASADAKLCGRRLTGTIFAAAKGERNDQGKFWDDSRELPGTFDVKGLTLSTDHIKFGLTFSKKDVDKENFSHFAGRSGRLEIAKTEAIDEESSAADPEKS